MNATVNSVLKDVGRVYAAVKHGWLIVVASMAICLSLAVTYLVFASRSYKAQARLLVMQQEDQPVQLGSSQEQRGSKPEDKDYVATQSGVIASPLIIERAIKSIGLHNLPCLHKSVAGKDPVDVVATKLEVYRPDRSASIIQIDYIGRSPSEATRLVQALIDSYQQFLLCDIYGQTNEQIIHLISSSESDLNTDVATLEQQYIAFKREHPEIISISKPGQTGRTVAVDRLDHLTTAVSELEIRELRLRAQLDLSRKLVKSDANLWAIAYAIGELGNNTGELLRTLDQHVNPVNGNEYLRQLIQEQQRLVEQNGSGSSKVLELQDRIQRLQSQTRDVSGADTRDLLRSLEQTLDGVKALLSNYHGLLHAEVQRVNEAEILALTEDNLRTNLERQRALVNTVMDQRKHARLVSGYNLASFRVIASPSCTGKPISPIISLTVALSMFVGFSTGCGLSFWKFNTWK